MDNGFYVEFRGSGIVNGSVKIRLYSKLTGIYGTLSGNGKSKFVEFIDEGINRDGTIEVIVPNGYTFDIIDRYATIERYRDDPKAILLIDELDMIRGVANLKDIKCILIAVGRGQPCKFKGDYPLRGMYDVEWGMLEDGTETVNVKHVQKLPILESIGLADVIVVEGTFEYDILSCYFKNVVNAEGRDKIEKCLRPYKDKRVVVFADLGNIGRTYSILMKRVRDNPNITFYPYECIEQLFCASPYIRSFKRKSTVHTMDCLNLEKYFDEKLKQITVRTEFAYNHDKKKPDVYKPNKKFSLQEYIEKFFNSKIGKPLYDYIRTSMNRY